MPRLPAPPGPAACASGVLHPLAPRRCGKWCRRGTDYSLCPQQLCWRATADERCIVCLLRRETRFPLDDLTAVARHFLPQLSRDAIYCVLKAEGLARLADLLAAYDWSPPRKGTGHFKDYDPVLYADGRQATARAVHGRRPGAPALTSACGDRRLPSRSVHLVVKNDLTRKSGIAFLHETIAALPSRISTVLTDRGSARLFIGSLLPASAWASSIAGPECANHRPTAWSSAPLGGRTSADLVRERL